MRKQSSTVGGFRRPVGRVRGVPAHAPPMVQGHGHVDICVVEGVVTPDIRLVEVIPVCAATGDDSSLLRCTVRVR